VNRDEDWTRIDFASPLPLSNDRCDDKIDTSQGERMEIENLLKRIDSIRNVINKNRPLSAEEVEQLHKFYRLGLTYSSNALEGNSLSLSETKVLIEDGLTVQGKPIKDCYEATGHAEAYNYMLSIAGANALTVTEGMIKELHRMFYQRVDESKAGKYRDHQVIITGTEYVPPTAEDVPELMTRFLRNLDDRKEKTHPVILAAYAHRKLVDIHPFADGNGRTARLLMNLILINRGYLVVQIPPVLRPDYIEALRIAQRREDPSDKAFNELIANCEIESQKDYCRLFHLQTKELK
jgi:Fic family protein